MLSRNICETNMRRMILNDGINLMKYQIYAKMLS